eukprot:jgi/Botrbrau1/2544/Bobra.0079s0031.1
MTIGVLVGFLASLALKTRLLKSKHTPLESCLCILIAFASYMLADGLQLSGIVSILFCGMIMAHYARPNLTRSARDRTLAFFRILATLSETFVFIYIGASLAREDQAWASGFTWSLMGLLLAAIAWSRAANIGVCSRIINYLRPPELRIPDQHKFMMWWAGLRGAIAFALSLEASEDLADEGKGRVLLTTSLLMVLTTVLVNGGAAANLLEKLDLRAVPGGVPPGGFQLPSAGPSMSIFPRFSGTETEEVEGPRDSQRLLGLPSGTEGQPPPEGGGTGEMEEGLRGALPGSIGPSDSGDCTAQYRTASESADVPLAEIGSTWSVSSHELSAAATRFLKNSIATSVQKVREANRQGWLTQLEAFDTRYLQKLFVRPEQDDADTPLGPRDADVGQPSSQMENGQPEGADGAAELTPGASLDGDATSGNAATSEGYARLGGGGEAPWQLPSQLARVSLHHARVGMSHSSSQDEFDPWGLRSNLSGGATGSDPAGGPGALPTSLSLSEMTRAYSVGNPRLSFTGLSWPALRPGSPLEGIAEGLGQEAWSPPEGPGPHGDHPGFPMETILDHGDPVQGPGPHGDHPGSESDDQEPARAGPDLASGSDPGTGGYVLVDSYCSPEDSPILVHTFEQQQQEESPRSPTL